MARACVEASRDPVAIIIAQHGSIVRQYRSEDFPWLPTGIGQASPNGSEASEFTRSLGQYSDIEEIEADIWLRERDARGVLAMTEQVLAQHQGYSMICCRLSSTRNRVAVSGAGPTVFLSLFYRMRPEVTPNVRP